MARAQKGRKNLESRRRGAARAPSRPETPVQALERARRSAGWGLDPGIDGSTPGLSARSRDSSGESGDSWRQPMDFPARSTERRRQPRGSRGGSVAPWRHSTERCGQPVEPWHQPQGSWRGSVEPWHHSTDGCGHSVEPWRRSTEPWRHSMEPAGQPRGWRRESRTGFARSQEPRRRRAGSDGDFTMASGVWAGWRCDAAE